jgi:hypothetical protein
MKPKLTAKVNCNIEIVHCGRLDLGEELLWIMKDGESKMLLTNDELLMLISLSKKYLVRFPHAVEAMKKDIEK